MIHIKTKILAALTHQARDELLQTLTTKLESTGLKYKIGRRPGDFTIFSKSEFTRKPQNPDNLILVIARINKKTLSDTINVLKELNIKFKQNNNTFELEGTYQWKTIT